MSSPLRSIRIPIALLSLGLAAVPVLAGGSAVRAAPASMALAGVRQSLLATYTWYRPAVAGHPVLDTYYVERKDRATGKVTVEEGPITAGARRDVIGRDPITGLAQTEASVPRAAALGAAARSAPGTPVSAELVVVSGPPSLLVWSVTSASPRGSYRTLIDATSGAVLESRSMVQQESGTATLFGGPNPVVYLQDGTLTDQDDANHAALRRAYQTVTLTRLDGTGYLRGSAAYDANPAASLAHSASNTFTYDRSQPGFEQVMAYHAITSSQQYIQQLGFTAVNNEPQDFATVGLTDDNSFYDPVTDRITFGTGGVDDAEDREVIWHELGHAIQNAQIPGYPGSPDASAIGEGFGDYWAFTMSIPVSTVSALTPLACIADWDAVSYADVVPRCLRRVDSTKMYPRDVVHEPHADGEIWSRALVDLHQAVGRDLANKIVLEAQFSFVPNITFPAAASKTVETAAKLGGAAAETAARTAFKNRGIL